jgi:hypothetical protein
MTITHKTNMDLAGRGIAPKFDMVQGDFCARQIEFRLFSNNIPWSIPNDAQALIRFRRPDNSVGEYDTMPDGSSAYNHSGGNRIVVAVVPEVLTIPGTAQLVVTLYTQEQELSTFEVQIAVQENLSSGAALDGNYASITGMLPAPKVAAPGQLLVVEEVSDSGKVRSVKAVTTGSEIPECIKNEADRVAALVQNRQNANTFTFLVGGDLHLGLDQETTDLTITSAKHAAQAMERIRNQVHIDFAVLLGDYLSDSGETSDQAMAAFRLISQCFTPAFGSLPQFWLKGDHDYLTDAEELTDNQVFAGISIHNRDAIFPETSKRVGYCYRDFDAYKLRVICLAFPSDGNGHGLNQDQITWLENVLDVTGKGTDWKTLLLSHMPIDDFTQYVPMMNAVALKAGSIIANIHGHTHSNTLGTLVGTAIPRISIPALSPYCNDQTNNSGTAFCVVTVDLDNEKLYVDHYGTDKSQEIEL